MLRRRTALLADGTVRSHNGPEPSLSIFSYTLGASAIYLAVFLMRFSFAFTVVALQFLVPVQVDRGIISSAYPIMEMSTAFFFGLLADKVGRKWIIVGALGASSFITLSFTFTKDLALLAVIHGLQGMCAAAIITCTLALLTDFARKTTRGREMGIYDFSTISGYAIGFAFALILIDGNVSKALLPFYAGAAVAMIGAFLGAVLLRDSEMTHMARSTIRDNVKKITGSKSALTLIPAWFVLMMLLGVALTFTRELFSGIFPGPDHIFIFGRGSSLRITVLEATLLVLGSILLGFTQSSFGSMSDRFGRSKIIIIGEFSILGFLLTLVGLLHFNLNHYVAIPFVALFGAGLLAFTPAALAELADVAPETGRGSAMGLYSVTVGAGTVFGPLAGGAFITSFGIDDGLSYLFIFGALIIAIALLPRIIVSRYRTWENRSSINALRKD